jgi:hypothetical protein
LRPEPASIQGRVRCASISAPACAACGDREEIRQSVISTT